MIVWEILQMNLMKHKKCSFTKYKKYFLVQTDYCDINLN